MAGCAGICWALVWLLLLIIGGWPIGGLCAGFYLLLSPFSACIEALTPLIDLLEKGLKLPLTCALNMVHQKPLCWCADHAASTNGFLVLRHFLMHWFSVFICEQGQGVRSGTHMFNMKQSDHHSLSTFSESVRPQTMYKNCYTWTTLIY